MRPAVGRRTFRLGCWKVDAKMTKDCTGEITTTCALPLKGDGESSDLRVQVRRHKANRVCSVRTRHEGQCVRVRTHNISFELGMTMHQRCFFSELRATEHPCQVAREHKRRSQLPEDGVLNFAHRTTPLSCCSSQ